MSADNIQAPPNLKDSPFSQAFSNALEGRAPDTQPQPEPKAQAQPQPQPQPEPKAQPEPEDPDMPSEIRSEAGRKNWKAWKAEVNTKLEGVAKERDDLKAQIEELRKQPKTEANVEELSKLREQLQETQVKLRMRDIEADPEWHNTYVRPVELLTKQAASLVPSELRSAVEAALAISDPGAQIERLEAIADNLSPARVAQLASVAAQIHQIRGAAEARKSDQKALVADYERAVQERSRREQERMQGEVKAKIASTRTKLSAEHDVLKDAQVQQEIDNVLYGNSTPEEVIEAAHYAAIGKRASAAIKERDATITELRAQIAKLSQGRPSLGSSGDVAPSSEPKTFTKIMAEQLRR